MRALLSLKSAFFLLCVSSLSDVIDADPADPCAGMDGAVLTQCRGNQQTLQQQERLERELQQQQERQNQLDQQQREVQQQLATMRQQNESLREQLKRQAAIQAAQPAASSTADAVRASAAVKGVDLQNWKADNPWFGSDYSKTQFAMRYLKQLQRDRPELSGRELLDALTAKVDQTFAPKH